MPSVKEPEESGDPGPEAGDTDVLGWSVRTSSSKRWWRPSPPGSSRFREDCKLCRVSWIEWFKRWPGGGNEGILQKRRPAHPFSGLGRQLIRVGVCGDPDFNLGSLAQSTGIADAVVLAVEDLQTAGVC